MKNTMNVKMIYHFYHSAIKAELKKRGFSKDIPKKIDKAYEEIVKRAKDIGKSRLLSSYIMTSYFIAMNRGTGKSAEENYEIFRDGLCASKLFHKVIGDVDQYLDPKKMPEGYNGLQTAMSINTKMTGSLTFCREMENMIWDMTITNVVRASCVRMKGVRSWHLICAVWIMCLQTL